MVPSCFWFSCNSVTLGQRRPVLPRLCREGEGEKETWTSLSPLIIPPALLSSSWTWRLSVSLCLSLSLSVHVPCDDRACSDRAKRPAHHHMCVAGASRPSHTTALVHVTEQGVHAHTHTHTYALGTSMQHKSKCITLSVPAATPA